jgi:hypothetical protein
MEELYRYRCVECNRTEDYKKGAKPPVCCEKQMVAEPLPVCTSAPHPEMARTTDDDEPCDDGRGKR